MTRGPAITMQVCVQARIYAFLDMVQGSLNLVVDLSVDGGSNVLHTVPLNDWDVEGEAPEEASSSAVQVFVHGLYPRRAPGEPSRATNPAHRGAREALCGAPNHRARGAHDTRVHRARTQIPPRARVCALAGPWAAEVRIYVCIYIYICMYIHICI